MSGPGRGRLVLVGTPIGNLRDLTPRAADELAHADVVACEDTRHTGTMLARSGIAAHRLLSLHEHNEAARTVEILALLADGKEVALVSDAGMPLVSDPGARLVAAAAAEGHVVTVVPGPSAVLAALAVSGLASERFVYEGFLPRRGSERSERLAAVADSTCPSVIFEAPARIPATLVALAEVCGADRRVAVCRELTKLYEETWRGTLAEAVTRSASSVVRGEHVLVVDAAPAPAGGAPSEEIERSLLALLAEGISRRDAVEEVAERLGVRRRDVYDLALRLKLLGEGSTAG